ncbi:MAG: Crp/Fnr family transcriptional regulator [Dehalococcoidia bacterium]
MGDLTPAPATADLLRRVPFLAVLADGDRAALAASARRRRFRRAQAIFHKDEPGESLFIVERGSVRIYLPSPQGADLTLAVLGAGDFFGDMALLDGGPRSASAMALEETSALVLERGDFTSIIESRTESAMAVLASVARRLREADEMAGDLAFLDVAGRLAKRLLELAASHGVQRQDGVLLDLPLTQEELANMVGVTRESVNRHLGNLRRAGVLGGRGRRLVIRDMDGLRNLIG